MGRVGSGRVDGYILMGRVGLGWVKEFGPTSNCEATPISIINHENNVLVLQLVQY